MSSATERLPTGELHEAPIPDEPAVRHAGLPRKARIYLGFLALGTIAAAGKFYVNAPNIHHGWATFAVLAAAATVAHTFPVKSPRNAMYHTSVVFLVAAALLLPPELIVLIPLVQTVPEWLKEPYRAIHEEEQEHGSFPAAVIARLATTEESQMRARRAVAMSLVLRKQYFDDLDDAVLRGKTW